MIYGAKIGIISESAKLFHAVLQETVQFLVQSTHNCCHKVLSFNNFVLPTLCHFATLPHCHIKHLAMWEGWEAERYYKYIIIIYLYIIFFVFFFNLYYTFNLYKLYIIFKTKWHSTILWQKF